ncbi:MAG: asparagine synthase (glutamine-hydrolyzing) [Candidatus Omnitrophica bacterium]|nr:asparagine synthase (glutamine-hydrolyzing) [Candidatus Omnitrophota bacterium]
MCGIVGFLSFNKNNNIFDIETATKLLSHRGPDNSGAYKDEWVSLGHTRLSIIDVEKGSQPIFNEDGNVVLIFNGEVYNHNELRENLLVRGHIFRSRCDSEVIIHAYEEYGIEKALSLFNGMFAFSIWDKRVNKLFLARDRIGIKPLYYSLQRGFMIFASEIKAMTTNGIIPKRLRKECLFEYVTTNGVFGKNTMFEGVSEMEPAHYLSVDTSGKISIKRYWDMVSLVGTSSIMDDEEEILSCLDEKFKESVDYRLISDVPIGILLSGGIDSSLVSYYVAKSTHANAKKVKFFNAKNVTSEIDESPYAEMQVEFLNKKFGRKIDFESALLDSTRFLEYFSYLTYIYDEPLQFHSSGFIYDMCRHAGEEGMKVLLIGDGSDELFFGYERFERTLCDLEMGSFDGFSENDMIYFGGGINNLSIAQRLTGIDKRRVKEIESYKWLEFHNDLELKMRMMFHSIRFRLQSVLMRMDRMSMACGVEVRVPFLDHNIIEFANRIDSGIKYKDNIPKYIIKRLSKDKVHDQIIERKKLGSPSDIAYWINTSEAQELINDLTSSTSSISKSELNYSVVKEIINLHYSGKKKYSTLIWMLLSLEIWNKAVLKEGMNVLKASVNG